MDINKIIDSINKFYGWGFIARPVGVTDIYQVIKEMKQRKDKPHYKRYAEIFMLRYGLNGKPLTLSKVGEIYGIGPERVRQIEFKAETIIKAYIRYRLGTSNGD